MNVSDEVKLEHGTEKVFLCKCNPPTADEISLKDRIHSFLSLSRRGVAITVKVTGANDVICWVLNSFNPR